MKILASDYDGTLLIDHKLSKENQEAIKRFREEGNIIGLCTGRPTYGFHEIKGLAEFDFYICNTGGVILDGNKKEISRRGFPINVAQEIGEKTYKNAIVMIPSDNAMYLFADKEDPDLFKKDIKKIVTTDLSIMNDSLIGMMSVGYKTEKEARDLVKYINEKYKDVCCAHQNQTYVDVVAPNCSKATGLREIIEHYNFNKDDVYVIGDSYNDLPMFEESNHSFTFPYAPNVLKEKADYIVKDVAEAIKILLDD